METSNLGSSNIHSCQVLNWPVLFNSVQWLMSTELLGVPWFMKVFVRQLVSKWFLKCGSTRLKITSSAPCIVIPSLPTQLSKHTHNTHTRMHTHTANTCKNLTNQDCKQRHSWLAKSHPYPWKFVPSGHTCLFTYYSASSIHWLRTCLRWGPEPLKRSSINLDRALKEQLVLRE